MITKNYNLKIYGKINTTVDKKKFQSWNSLECLQRLNRVQTKLKTAFRVLRRWTCSPESPTPLLTPVLNTEWRIFHRSPEFSTPTTACKQPSYWLVLARAFSSLVSGLLGFLYKLVFKLKLGHFYGRR